jgi:peptidoglycan/LPS O-acetylase OafA/YrhL
MASPRIPERLYLLDLLRGFAALAVLMLHWQFFGSDSNRIAPLGGFPPVRAIGEACLSFFYQCGGSAVGLFFTLSGFVFFWLFREKIRDRRISGWQFFVDRFSRLYPLHLATLILVGVGQFAYASMNGGLGWVSHVNDLQGFVRNLLVFPLWTRERMVEFNLPVWSLAVEALVYVVFFGLAQRTRLDLVGTCLMVAIGICLNWYSNDIGYGFTAFFMGGLSFIAFERLPHATVERPLAIVAGSSWAFALVFGSGLVNLAATPIWWLDGTYATYVLFPVTVLYLSILETRRGPTGARLRWLGDATYSMYLLGFPSMLAIALVVKAFGLSFDAVKSPLVLAAFLLAIVPLAVMSHYGFERPVQQVIRRKFAEASRAISQSGQPS